MNGWATLVLALGVLVQVGVGCATDPDAIRIRTRPCAIEGSPQADGKSPGQEAEGDLRARIKDAGKIWRSAANIEFDTWGAFAYPVIADPDPPVGSGERLGDVDAGFLALEPKLAADECAAAWSEYDPDAKGPVVVNARAFVNAGLTMGVTPPVPHALRVKSASPLTGKRGDDFCGHPRHLTSTDVAATSWTVVVDQALFGGGTYSGDFVVVLAHELGHVLMLGHGNGLDDNADGLEPPAEGPRRFDEYCDQLGLNASGDTPIEDGATPFTTCEESSSMMKPFGTNCRNLTPLQVEQAREVALLVPGVSKGGVFLDND